MSLQINCDERQPFNFLQCFVISEVQRQIVISAMAPENLKQSKHELRVICISVLTQVSCSDLEWGLARAFDAVTDGLASRPMRREEQVASWPIRAQLLKPGRLNGSEEKRRQGNEAEELDVGQSRSSLAPDRSRFGSRRRGWELFCGIGWTRGGRDIKKGGGQICGPRCVTLLGNPGYQQLHTLLAPSTPATAVLHIVQMYMALPEDDWWVAGDVQRSEKH